MSKKKKPPKYEINLSDVEFLKALAAKSQYAYMRSSFADLRSQVYICIAKDVAYLLAKMPS
jgi:hypothetical protein